MERGVGKVRKALTLLMDGKFGSPFLSSPPPVLVQERVNARILLRSNLWRWFLLALPPKNRTCEFPRIRLKWRRFELDPNNG
ncbi:hypothetical protein JHK85_049510 [Glycine max]|nr:hypothetical protein JHK85_049510 [Glycine max]